MKDRIARKFQPNFKVTVIFHSILYYFLFQAIPHADSATDYLLFNILRPTDLSRAPAMDFFRSAPRASHAKATPTCSPAPRLPSITRIATASPAITSTRAAAMASRANGLDGTSWRDSSLCRRIRALVPLGYKEETLQLVKLAGPVVSRAVAVKSQQD